MITKIKQQNLNNDKAINKNIKDTKREANKFKKLKYSRM